MGKKYKILIMVILVGAISFSILLVNRDRVYSNIMIMIDKRLDYERSLEVGDEFNKLVWGDFMFQINHYQSGVDLDYVKNEEKATLLGAVKDYRILVGKLYVTASKGYAVIDENNICRVFITVDDSEFAEDDRYIEDEHIQYLTEYNEFSDEERKMLEKMSK